MECRKEQDASVIVGNLLNHLYRRAPDQMYTITLEDVSFKTWWHKDIQTTNPISAPRANATEMIMIVNDGRMRRHDHSWDREALGYQIDPFLMTLLV